MLNTDLGNLFSGTAEALWQLGKEKDSVAWSKIVKMHSTGMLNTAKGVLTDYFLAEDAVQNALLQIRDLSAEYFRRENDKSSKGIFSHQKENTIFTNDFAARNWIIRITYFVAKNMKKSLLLTKEREKVFTQNWVEERENRSTPDQEMLTILQKEIEQLPEDLRLPLVLRFHCDMNFNQVSSELGLAVHVIRQRVQKGIEVLQTKISAIVGSSMSVVGVESLLNNVISLNESIADSLFKNYADLLDKPALTKSQLIPENKLLLQSSKFMVKGLVMLKILAVLVVLVFTGMLVVNTIQSNESIKDKEAKEKELALEKLNQENISSKQKAEVSKESNSKQNNFRDVSEIKTIDKNATITYSKNEKTKEFDIGEILPYFSEKAIFTLIMPDISKSADRFSASSVSKFYADPSVDLLTKVPLIMKEYLDIDTGSFSSELTKIIIEYILSSFSCIGGQYSFDISSKTPSFFVVGLIRSENEKTFELILEAIRPFHKETKKLGNGLDINTYQFLEKQPLIQIIKFENKVFFGNADSNWTKNLESHPSSSYIKKSTLTSDIFWKLDLNTYFESKLSYLSEDKQKVNKILNAPKGYKFLEKIKGELNIQEDSLSHKIEVPFKATGQKQVWEVLSLKKISSSMLEQIPGDRKALICFNLDLISSLKNYNAFKDDYFKQIISNGGEEYEYFRKDYKEKYDQIENKCNVIFQMTLNELFAEALNGELISWISSNPQPMQTIRLGVKNVEFANKIVAGLIAIFGKESGVTVHINGNYINIILPISKDLINQNFQKSTSEEKIASTRPNSEIIKMNYYSWLDNNFSANQSKKLLLFQLFSQRDNSNYANFQSEFGLMLFKLFSQSDNSNYAIRQNDLGLLNLFCSSIANSETSFSISKEKLNLEFEGLDDVIQLLIGGALLNKKFKNDSSLKFTEIKRHMNVNNKSFDYVYARGNLLNGLKTGHWVFYNEEGKIISEGEFKNDKETGQWKILHHIFKYPSIGEMKLGKKVGVWKAYHIKSDILAEVGEYIDDKKVGIWQDFYENGSKHYEEKYNESGLLEGERLGWDKQGNIFSKEDYKSGYLKSRSLFNKQHLCLEEEYAKDENFLLWSKEYEGSNFNLQREYRLDIVNAMAFDKEYFPNGQLKSSKQYIVLMKDGKRGSKKPVPTGEWLEWYENNSRKMLANFDKEGSGQKVFYHENGIKCAEYQLEKGVLSGLTTGWYDNGNIFFTGNYQEGKLNGKWTIWYYEGNKKAEGKFKNGTVSSGWKLWSNNGELKEELDFDSISIILDNKKIEDNTSKIYNFAKEFNFLKSSQESPSFMDQIVQYQKENKQNK